jgi:hypothetical protein
VPGPVGLTLALDLGRRGVRCILVETERGTAIPAENGALQRPHHGVVSADPGVLDSYEIERRQAGERNVGASRHAAMGCRSWRKLCGREIYENSSQDAAARGRLAAVADVQQRKINEMTGAELGYRYADSSIVDGVPGDPEYLFQNTGPAWPDGGCLTSGSATERLCRTVCRSSASRSCASPTVRRALPSRRRSERAAFRSRSS